MSINRHGLGILLVSVILVTSVLGFFSDELILNTVNEVSKYSLGLFDSMQAPDAFEDYVSAIPRNITQLDVDGFTTAFNAQLLQRIIQFEKELREVASSYPNQCTPKADGTTPLDHFGIPVYDGVAIFGPASDEFKSRAKCALDVVTHMPNTSYPLVSQNDYMSWAMADDATDQDLSWTSNTSNRHGA